GYMIGLVRSEAFRIADFQFTALYMRVIFTTKCSIISPRSLIMIHNKLDPIDLLLQCRDVQINIADVDPILHLFDLFFWANIHISTVVTLAVAVAVELDRAAIASMDSSTIKLTGLFGMYGQFILALTIIALREYLGILNPQDNNVYYFINNHQLNVIMLTHLTGITLMKEKEVFYMDHTIYLFIKITFQIMTVFSGVNARIENT
ncbi:hypothetical protein ACJX0J_032482, partial [Zea mays]